MPLAEIVLAVLDGDQAAMRKLFVRLLLSPTDAEAFPPRVRAALLHEVSRGLSRDSRGMPAAACREMRIAPGSSFAAGAAKILALSNGWPAPEDPGDRPALLM